MLDQPIVMLDFETTGLTPVQGDRITEVAALRIVGGQVVERYVSLVNCGVRIPSFITGLTGITQAMVDSAPPAAQVVPALLDFIGSDPLSAHNASFDEKFLRAEAARLDLAPRHAALVCSLKLSRRVFPQLGSYKLGQLSGALGIRFRSAAHRAEADAEVAAQVLIHIGQHLRASYGIGQVDTDLLVSVNKLAAAKVPQFLQKRGQPV
ncbi:MULTISPECIES: PolC-type DNA polymerase III [unclassified Duganella]|uniref:3'-5' exonuclease n=1 Tax=unclassified Duganella TaxID=2636909 RepID=UPI000890CD8C|nr:MULTISPECIES: 3'-5' exonuclease [unclassified Duganella]SDG79130.1 DNA polymerase-3 subunit epsilon [Duganella sp. OV458]SDK06200.1 DNA polymerase-3 subunit epsilon [Duganella sp. OV510]